MDRQLHASGPDIFLVRTNPNLNLMNALRTGHPLAGQMGRMLCN